MPDRSQRINSEELRSLALFYGMHLPFQQFYEKRDMDALKIAKENSFLTGRNFSKEAQRYLGISKEDLSKLI